jgi:hypothetical protein
VARVKLIDVDAISKPIEYFHVKAISNMVASNIPPITNWEITTALYVILK